MQGDRTLTTTEAIVPRALSSPLSGAVESFERAHTYVLKPLTMRSYLGSLKRFQRFLGPDAKLRDFDLDNANLYIASIADKKHMARLDAAVLKVFAKWLARARIVPRDPLLGMGTPKVPKSRPRPYDEALVPHILRVASESKMGARDRAILVVSLATGARPNEIRQLRFPEDVDLERGVIRIREETSKTAAGHREIPLDPQAIAVIDEYLKDYRPNVAGPLFLHQNGTGLSYGGFLALHYRLRDRLRKEGIQGYKSYRNRHSGLTNLARAEGMTPADLKYLAGHESIGTTMTYLEARRPEAMRRFASAFSQAYGRVS